MSPDTKAESLGSKSARLTVSPVEQQLIAPRLTPFAPMQVLCQVSGSLNCQMKQCPGTCDEQRLSIKSAGLVCCILVLCTASDFASHGIIEFETVHTRRARRQQRQLGTSSEAFIARRYTLVRAQLRAYRRVDRVAKAHVANAGTRT